MKRNYWFIALGIVWTVIFSGMSFYWAMGGLVGVRSLGGSVYEMSINPAPSFVIIVWLTGFIKLLGLILLLMILIKWKKPIINRMLYYVTKIVGALLFLYGLLNFVTISLSALNILDFDLDSYATIWRLAFWEPFWVAAGVFYFFPLKEYDLFNYQGSYLIRSLNDLPEKGALVEQKTPVFMFWTIVE